MIIMYTWISSNELTAKAITPKISSGIACPNLPYTNLYTISSDVSISSIQIQASPYKYAKGNTVLHVKVKTSEPNLKINTKFLLPWKTILSW